MLFQNIWFYFLINLVLTVLSILMIFLCDLLFSCIYIVFIRIWSLSLMEEKEKKKLTYDIQTYNSTLRVQLSKLPEKFSRSSLRFTRYMVTNISTPVSPPISLSFAHTYYAHACGATWIIRLVRCGVSV